MASTTTSPTPTATSKTGYGGALQNEGQDWDSLLYAIYIALASFAGQFLVFSLLRLRLTRIYRPKSYLVAERERVPSPPAGFWQWVIPLFTTPNQVFIERCGLDAYFFLRFLRTLLKIFVPLSLVILPILVPINRRSCDSTLEAKCKEGADQLGWTNIAPIHTHRTWAHLVLACLTILWILYVIYTELRGYIRIRQAHLSSPQHRIRASATTVLVSGIPRKWLTVEALDGLYDVFPGGIRNIWINRNFDSLAEKVQERDGISRDLEQAETSLIQACVKKHKKAEEKKAKAEGHKKTKAQRAQDATRANDQAERLAQGYGVSSGDPHQTPHNLQEVLEEIEEDEHRNDHKKTLSQEGIRDKLGQGFGAVGHGFGTLGKIGRQFVGEVTDDVNRVIRNVNESVDQANNMAGFNPDHSDSPVKPAPLAFNSPKEILQEQPRSSDASTAADTRHDLNDTSTSDRPTGLQKPEDVTVLDRTDPPKLAQSDWSEPSSSNAQTDVGGRQSAEPSSPNNAHDHANPLKSPKKAWHTLVSQAKASPIPFPSPQPHAVEEDEYPLRNLGQPQHPDLNENPKQGVSKSKWANTFGFLKFWEKGTEEEKVVYPEAFNEDLAGEETDEPVWKRYLAAKDRETLREPIFAKSWFPRLPLVGKKIDKIYYLRKELARLNVEIEADQQNVERFPFMNSAFIQFNHQVAAHMACQSLSHHVPQNMAPRLVEISPTDILWDNMSSKWWERTLRSGIVFGAFVGIVFLYAPLVSFTGLISSLNSLQKVKWLHWIDKIPEKAQDIIQGILPPVLLSIILALIPIVLRLLVKQGGVPTGNDREMGVQNYYFAFLFIQVFLIGTLSSGLPKFFEQLVTETTKVVPQLAQNLPKASNYFLTYLTVQAFNNSASALLQVAGLLEWFFWAPINDNTARQKWARATKLKNIRWGSFFPPFTNFAVIGIIFSIIAPIIMLFNLVVFSVYWITQRYNTLYVYQFQNDTGGLLFPTAINQLFVGLYVMELALIALFFTQLDTKGKVAGTPQAIIMIIFLVGTAIFQWLLNDSFQPSYRYLPITLEDDAVVRDEEFARAQRVKWETLAAEEQGENFETAMQERERREAEEEERALAEERRTIREHRQSNQGSSEHTPIMSTKPSREWTGDRWRKVKDVGEPVRHLREIARPHAHGRDGHKPTATMVNPERVNKVDIESQRAMGDILFGGYSDELEDLTPEERDTLIRYSFQHSALRARRPVVWIPRDHLGVSDDEIQRTKRMSTVENIHPETEKRTNKTHIWISNEGTALDAKGKVVFRKSPPDFANVDLIAL